MGDIRALDVLHLAIMSLQAVGGTAYGSRLVCCICFG